MSATLPGGTPAEPCDVLVIGGGPAGATIATLLARQGRRVVPAKKTHPPRCQVGESRSPPNLDAAFGAHAADAPQQARWRRYRNVRTPGPLQGEAVVQTS